MSRARTSRSRPVWPTTSSIVCPRLARELIDEQSRRDHSIGASASRAKEAATTSTPILFFGNFDPVKLAFRKSLAQPGSNVTGIVIAPDGTLAAKKVEVLAQAASRGKTDDDTAPRRP